ncbi:MAG: hypothetical protein AB8B53_05740 [Flavobacteriales bacterium]
MSFNHIEEKKPLYKLKAPLKAHLMQYSRYVDLPVSYYDLTNHHELLPILDENDEHTLWYNVLFSPSELESLGEALIRTYELLVADGDTIPYLKIHSISFCSYGNSKPFRIKVINEINDNHDYFYVKKTDASRIYGLELEEILSPDKISFICNATTMIEEHVVGIPCDEFILKNKGVIIDNRLRFAKEFVKFNERCFVKLLGDMRAYNFVVEIIQDFDNVQYRFRPMDFDQQNYEGRKNMYLPQYYKDNIALVELCMELLSDKVAEQYKREERVAMRKRFMSNKQRTRSLLRRMRRDSVSLKKYVDSLKKDLAKHHNNPSFLEVKNMGELLTLHLETKLGVKVFR